MGQDEQEEKETQAQENESAVMGDARAGTMEEGNTMHTEETTDTGGLQAEQAVERENQEMDEEFGWDDVQEELEAGANSSEGREVSNVQFKEMKQSEVNESLLDIDFILDIPLTVSVELGRGKMMISELLKLGRGSIVELSKLAGEPLDVFVNNRLIAMGEVVVANEKFSIRLTDVVPHAERIDKLK